MLMSTRRSRREEAGEGAGSIGQSGGLAFHAWQAFLFSRHSRVAAAKQRILGVDIAGRVETVLDFSVAAKVSGVRFRHAGEPDDGSCATLGNKATPEGKVVVGAP
jgi:hypothetical protein